MIDLHCHLLPGLDDGPADMPETLEMARVAVMEGIDTIVATPHIRDDHPFDPAAIRPLVDQVNAALAAEGIGLKVLAGAEVALTKVSELSDEELGRLCLGAGRHLLIESPYTHATDLLENDLWTAQLRGFQVVLAHPERSPSFQADLRRLAALVERGVLCSITAASMSGRFGKTVRRFTVRMLGEGLVHDVASDAHGPVGRRPALMGGFEALERELRGLRDAADWYTRAVPEAIVTGAEVPPRPERPARARGLSRLLGGR